MIKQIRQLNRLKFVFVILLTFIITSKAISQTRVDSLFEDIEFKTTEQDSENIFFTSTTVDFIQIPSTINDSVKFAIVVYKPSKPSPILILSHGWHMSVKPPRMDSENPNKNFLAIQVDMRGRKYSTGEQDCNGYELYDFYDAYKYVIMNYQKYICDSSQVYYSGGSGGGGNGYALVGKFPDLFCSANIGCGISDYADWYKNDTIGEFRDEMLPWIGYTPSDNPEAYASRSGITTIPNLLSPVYITHGDTDLRVSVTHARNFLAKAEALHKEVHYLELKNVGDRNHWGKITEEQKLEKAKFESTALNRKNPPVLPEKGKLVVAGYVVTKKFSVFMDSVNSVGEIEYNLQNKTIRFIKGEGSITWLK